MSKPGFPVWWEYTVTVYNKYVDPQTNVIRWYSTIINDCFWHLTGTQMRLGDVVLDSKAIICRIPKDPRFLEKQQWLELPNDEKENHFTLAVEDIIVKGECDFEINEYVKGHRSTDLLDKYKNYQAIMQITEYGNNVGAGRNNEHYLARGK